MLERRSASTSQDSHAGTKGPRSLTIGEVRGFALLQAAAFAATEMELERVLHSALGVDLPKRIDTPSRAAGYCVFKVGPGLFWIVGPEDVRAMSMQNGAQSSWIACVRDAVPAAIGSVTSLSHGRTRLFIEGTSAREVLSTGIAIDLHPDVFQRDAYALTGLQGTPVLLHRTGLDRYELYVLRTFTGWIWEWLTDAALPFGFEVTDA